MDSLISAFRAKCHQDTKKTYEGEQTTFNMALNRENYRVRFFKSEIVIEEVSHYTSTSLIISDDKVLFKTQYKRKILDLQPSEVLSYLCDYPEGVQSLSKLFPKTLKPERLPDLFHNLKEFFPCQYHKHHAEIKCEMQDSSFIKVIFRREGFFAVIIKVNESVILQYKEPALEALLNDLVLEVKNSRLTNQAIKRLLPQPIHEEVNQYLKPGISCYKTIIRMWGNEITENCQDVVTKV